MFIPRLIVCIKLTVVLLFCAQRGYKTIQHVVEMVACEGNVEGYLQFSDYIIQQIKYAHLEDVSKLHSES